MINKAINRLKSVLVEQGKTNKWLAEQTQSYNFELPENYLNKTWKTLFQNRTGVMFHVISDLN